MKERLLKKSTSILSLVLIICMLVMIFVPNYVKSSSVKVTSMTNTWRGIGKAQVFTSTVKGYSNLYCVRGGATLDVGMELNDNGVSLYTTTGAVVTNSSAMQWLLDNIYLTESSDAEMKKIMKENLKAIMRKYNTYKDENGNAILNKKLNGNGIDNKWIDTCIEDVINDTATLYAVQQYAMWNHVKNKYTHYYNVMENSNGYNAIPNAKAKQVHYTALYITLNELAKEAQNKGYVSPNNSNKGIEIKLSKQESTKATISSDKKSALVGPFKLENNNSLISKVFSASINGENAGKVETVDANGKAMNVSGTQNEFYLNVSYDKGFNKGTKYEIKVDVALAGYKTTALLLDTTNIEHQPLVSINREPYHSSTSESVIYEEKLTGDYNLVIEKVDSSNGSKKIEGVTFKVKEGESEKTYGPTDSNGLVSIFNGRKIEAEGVDTFTITEVDLGENKYVKLKEKEEVTFYIKKSKTQEAFVASSASFAEGENITSKEVTLEDGSKAVVSIALTGSTVKVTIPNKPEEKPKDFDMALRKFISEVKRDGQNVNIGKSREPIINASSASQYLREKTAGYYHVKNPVSVKTGDTVIYTIRVYNEGYIEGFAKEITDYLPQELEFVENSEINKSFGWKATKNQDGTTTVKTDNLKDTLIPAANGAEGFLHYNALVATGETNIPDFAKDVKIECKVVGEVESNKTLVNIAEITNYGYNDKDGKYVEANSEGIDIDSEENNVFTKNNNAKNIDEYYENVVKTQNTTNNYKGIQDDDDFENVIVAPTLSEFKFVLNKVDGEGNPLIGADFTVQKNVNNKTETLLDNEEVKGTYEVLESNVSFNTTYTYRVVEVESAPEYVNVMEGKYIIINTYMNNDKNLVLGIYKHNTIAVTDEDGYYAKYGFTIHNENGSLVKDNETDLYGKITVGVNNNTEPKQVTIKIPNEKEKKFDLALRKYITGVNDKEVTSRIPVFKIDENGNYVYNHDKEPVLVKSENVVSYTLRVYNEGEVNGYATKVIDNVPEGLEFLPENDLNKEYRWVMYEELGKDMSAIPEATIIHNKKQYIKTEDPKKADIIVTDYLSKEQEKEAGSNLIEAFDKKAYEEGKIKEPDYKEVKAAFKVVAPNTSNEIIINQAQIADDSDEEGKEVEDIDSTPNEWIDGEDDQDIEKIKLEYKKFDLALRKFITGVNDKEVTSRIPVFKIDEKGNYVYNHDKEPVLVKSENVVSYTLRVYNEGEVNGYATKVIDNVPEGLEFLPENDLNKEYRWVMYEELGKDMSKVPEDTIIHNKKQYVKTEDPKKADIIVTDYLSKEQEKEAGSNLIEAFDKKAYEEGKIKEPDHKEVKAAFKVIAPNTSNEIIINQAQIADDSDEEGKEVEDIDSTPNEWIDGEDDQDIEKIKLEYKKFDLALRKFITGVNDKEVTSRIPVFKIDENGNYIYNHDKEPVLVADSNIVTYTLRVYNEGEVSGYAQEVKDNIPAGLEFLPENNLNKKYRWLMLDKDGKETTEVESAKYIVTDYLSKEQEKEEGSNLIKAFDEKAYEDGKIKEPDYKEVKVSFKVVAPGKTNEVIINEAQISKHADEEGNDIPDIDSTPNEWIDGEDDQDIEKIRPQYFDLSLRKWVTKAIVIENGNETITETGHKAEDDPEAIVKVDLKDSDINNLTVKFEYKIRVKNEGQIPGYATEVSDYIPEGLKFVQEDNPDWKEVEGKVVTDKLKDTLLKTDETAEVTILLTWINGTDNMGLKTNIAEISKDYNEYGAPDIDSTPNNKVPGEDDIDDARVMLTVKTGQAPIYIMLTVSVLGIVAGGIVGIKKFVL